MSRLNLVLASGAIFDNDGNCKKDIPDFLANCLENDYGLIIVTHDNKKIGTYSQKIEKTIGKKNIVFTRKWVRKVFKQENVKNELKTTIVIGASDVDLYLATNFKLLFLYPLWGENKGKKAEKYGSHIRTTKDLKDVLSIINNQVNFYYRLKIDNKSTLFALTSANNNYATKSESDMINRFREVLKKGDGSYFEPLFFHLISSIMKSENLREIDIWAIMPSSGFQLNKEMLDIKERCRYLTKKQYREPLFFRNKEVPKSHHTEHYERLKVGAKKHLNSIHINEFYKGKLKNKVVCVLDDYITNGASFEAIRALLLHAGVKRIYFFAFGRFKKGESGVYQKEDYCLHGDIYAPDYTYDLLNKDSQFGTNGEYCDESKAEVENIKKILDN